MNSSIPVGVCICNEATVGHTRVSADGRYIYEILSHAGLCYRPISPQELHEALPEIGILITVGSQQLAGSEIESLRRWLEAGGAWLSIAGTCAAESLLGVKHAPKGYRMFGGNEPESPLGEGYLKVHLDGHATLSTLRAPLHYFNGVAVQADGATVLATAMNAHQQPVDMCVMTENGVGRGCAMLIAADAVGTVVRMQQGLAIVRDGMPPADGSASVSDGLLKSDDGSVLDWTFDRRDVPGVDGFKAYVDPLADCWRDVILKTIFHLAGRQGIALPLLWLYPRNQQAIAHLSHDSDGNSAPLAEKMLEVLADLRIRSTWCIIDPGYSPDLLRQVHTAGHELAMHYDALAEDREWSQEEFNRQYNRLKALFEGPAITTNKNHYLRWQGYIEFYLWCQAAGIQMDQSKGASKTGGAGFNFGSCHPYFPIDCDGQTIDVLALATLTQDLEVFAPKQLADALLDAVLRHHGVLHVLFHPYHINKAPVEDALRYVVRLAQQRGLEWLTAEAINRWERSRRQVSWPHFAQANGSARLQIRAALAMEQATMLWLLPRQANAVVDGRPAELNRVNRWGFEWVSLTMDLQAGTDHSIEAHW